MTIKSRHVTVKGPRGELSRGFKHLNLAFELVGGNKDKGTNPKKLKVDLWFGNRKQLATIRTVCSHFENLITGVTKGFLYKMRFVYAHFPINVSLTDKTVEVRNFLGEKRVRRVELLPGVEYVRTSDVKDQIELKGNDLTTVSLTAARIQQCTTVKRKYVFVEGGREGRRCEVYVVSACAWEFRFQMNAIGDGRQEVRKIPLI